MAYSFTDNDNVDAKPAMVPMADILNHVSDNNARLEFGDEFLSMVTTQRVKKVKTIITVIILHSLKRTFSRQRTNVLSCALELWFCSFTFPVNGKRQGVTLAGEFSFSFFVSNFLSHVKRIINIEVLNQQVHSHFIDFQRKICLCPAFVV